MRLVGDGRLGHPVDGPYNAIHVGAAADTLPQEVSTTGRDVQTTIQIYIHTQLGILDCLWGLARNNVLSVEPIGIPEKESLLSFLPRECIYIALYLQKQKNYLLRSIL